MDSRKDLELRCYQSRTIAEEFIQDKFRKSLEFSAREYVHHVKELLGDKYDAEWYNKVKIEHLTDLYDNAIDISIKFMCQEPYFMGWDEELQTYVDTRAEENKNLWFISMPLPSDEDMKQKIKEKYLK